MKNESIEAVRGPREDLSRAEAITVADFSTALSGGVLRAIDARKRPSGGVTDFRPWVWAGWIIGDGPLPGGGFNPGNIKDQQQPFG